MYLLLALLIIAVAIFVIRRKNLRKYVTYSHHGNVVSVRRDLKGKHRDHCLCFSCKAFYPINRDLNCDIANKVYNTCVVEGLVTPVWECPKFSER